MQEVYHLGQRFRQPSVVQRQRTVTRWEPKVKPALTAAVEEAARGGSAGREPPA